MRDTAERRTPCERSDRQRCPRQLSPWSRFDRQRRRWFLASLVHGTLQAVLAHLQQGNETRIVHGADPDVALHLPEHDVDGPELSIVVPAADEELTVGDFVR